MTTTPESLSALDEIALGNAPAGQFPTVSVSVIGGRGGGDGGGGGGDDPFLHHDQAHDEDRNDDDPATKALPS